MSWTEGYLLTEIALPPITRSLVIAQQWENLEKLMGALLLPGAGLRKGLERHKSFTSVEHMLALRDGANSEEEDGIWHDDSSRVLAFSLALNFFGLPEGGQLEIRRRGEESGVALGPFEPGRLIIFNTGLDGFEHRTRKVTAGLRLVCAGWCS